MINKIKKMLGMEHCPSDDEINDALNEWEQPKTSIVNLTREQLGGITLDFVNEGMQLTENEIKELQANADILRNNKAFKMIADHLINSQCNFTVKEATDAMQIFFSRATINGISLFKEEVERLAGLHRESVKADEKFDRSDMI